MAISGAADVRRKPIASDGKWRATSQLWLCDEELGPAAAVLFRPHLQWESQPQDLPTVEDIKKREYSGSSSNSDRLNRRQRPMYYDYLEARRIIRAKDYKYVSWAKEGMRFRNNVKNFH